MSQKGLWADYDKNMSDWDDRQVEKAKKQAAKRRTEAPAAEDMDADACRHCLNWEPPPVDPEGFGQCGVLYFIERSMHGNDDPFICHVNDAHLHRYGPRVTALVKMHVRAGGHCSAFEDRRKAA